MDPEKTGRQVLIKETNLNNKKGDVSVSDEPVDLVVTGHEYFNVNTGPSPITKKRSISNVKSDTAYKS